MVYTIYLDKKILNKLKERQTKYKVCISTIANFSIQYIATHLTKEQITEYKEQIKNKVNELKKFDEKYQQKNIVKSSVKPKNECNINIDSWYIVLALYLMEDKELRNDILKEKSQDYCNRMNSVLKMQKENFYNYNNYIRNFTRFIKKNKEYVRKLIE